jgi:DNA repair protein RadC
METTDKRRQFEVAEIQLSYKSKVMPSQRPKITSSKDDYDILLKKLRFILQNYF